MSWRWLLVGLVAVAATGCARHVTIAPELVPGRNDPDWVIQSEPAAAESGKRRTPPPPEAPPPQPQPVIFGL